MFDQNKVICTDKYLYALNSSLCKDSRYFKHDYLFQDGFWRGSEVKSCHWYPDLRVVGIGHSDAAVDDTVHATVSRFTHAKKVFAVNNTSALGYGLPLGITNWTNETQNHVFYGNTDIMAHVANQPVEKSNTPVVYLNVNITTNPAVRKPVVDMFRGQSWVRESSHVNTLDGRKRFLMDIRECNFAVCPEGNGVDTHRMWETLYMETIPIVKRSPVHRDWEDLPVYWVDSWDEVTSETLEQKYQELQPLFKTKEVQEKLTCEYWINKMLRD